MESRAGSHQSSDRFDNGHSDRVAELLVGSRIRDGDLPGVRIAHQARALAGRQLARIAPRATDEHFRTILVIAGRQGPAYIIRADQAEPKAIAFRAMLFGIGLQVVPEPVAQDVLCLDPAIVLEVATVVRIALRSILRVEHSSKARGNVEGRHLEVGPIEGHAFPKTNNENSFAMLRNEVARINDVPVNLVAQFIAQRAKNYLKRISAIVRQEILYVFQQERGRAFGLNNPRDVEEQSALGGALKSMRAT